jgi:pantoate--beta-alanine ligase
MDLIHTESELRARLRAQRDIVLVPTMGNLHAGHLALVKQARARGGCVVTTIFVNRLQFEPGGDFDRYPRTLEHDRALLAEAGCDVVFAPAEAEMYPVPQDVMVTPPKAARQLCGLYRPGHFEGVVTVVSKLFNLVRPQAAIFGKKDYQQLFVIRELVRQLNFGIEVLGGETVREPDGLAMSSRNGYLSATERAEAARLSRNLREVADEIRAGSRDYPSLIKAAEQNLLGRGWKVDYLEMRNREELLPPQPQDRNLVVLGAAWLGKTRLIDNFEV